LAVTSTLRLPKASPCTHVHTCGAQHWDSPGLSHTVVRPRCCAAPQTFGSPEQTLKGIDLRPPRYSTPIKPSSTGSYGERPKSPAVVSSWTPGLAHETLHIPGDARLVRLEGKIRQQCFRNLSSPSNSVATVVLASCSMGGTADSAGLPYLLHVHHQEACRCRQTTCIQQYSSEDLGQHPVAALLLLLLIPPCTNVV
jgi:hypothetical protein